MRVWGLAGAIASTVFLTVAAPGSNPALAAGGPLPLPLPCRPGFTTIRMTALASGHHAVAVMVNGRPGIFLVDTGAGATIIHAPYMRDFALVAAPAAPGGFGANADGRIRYEPVAVTAFAVGGTRTRLHRIYAMNISYIVDAVSASSPQPIQGLIGQDVLRDQKALIDVDQSLLYLADPDNAAGATCGAPENVAAMPAGAAVRSSL